MECPFRLPIRLNKDSQLVDAGGKVIVPTFTYASDWGHIRGAERNALYFEYLVNKYAVQETLETPPTTPNAAWRKKQPGWAGEAGAQNIDKKAT